ncbi:MAG: flippase activity-associated protein Agl23 [Verrucomicrobiota bacterium]
MKRLSPVRFAVLAAGWLAVLVTALFLRVNDLGERPFHADEATGARLTALRMENTGGDFNPTHFHGPLLGDVAAVVCRVRGENGWPEMTKGSLRLLPVAAGLLLALVPIVGRKRFGDGAMWLAGAFIACSPLLVVYSRMFIHEMLLTLFGTLFVLVLGKRGTSWLPGLLLGLMYATKETVVISVLAWAGAAACVLWPQRRKWRQTAVRWWRPVVLNIAVAAVVALAFYTRGFTHWRGAVDALMTFFTYETTAGHMKPAQYYLRLLAWPVKSAGMYWYGTPVVVLAGWAAWRALRDRWAWGQFLALSTLGHLAIYSFIGYKTPWLMCLPWAHVCLLAGTAVRGKGPARTAAWTVAIFTLATQAWQAKKITGRIESDPHNPYAYVPTRRDVETLTAWLVEMKKTLPLEPLAVVGKDIWPLPWYLRDFRTGYWQTLPADAAELPVLLILPDVPATANLAKTHVALPRGLRDGVPLMVFLRNDLWEQWNRQ